VSRLYDCGEAPAERVHSPGDCDCCNRSVYEGKKPVPYRLPSGRVAYLCGGCLRPGDAMFDRRVCEAERKAAAR
jgi:hypothetical protein